MYALLLILLLLSVFFYSNDIKQKFRIIALCWFLSVFFIEYYYSLIVNPIIQYSTLIFVFPFLLIFLFSLFGELNNYIKSFVVTAILIIGTFTLIFSRKHFEIFYKQPYQEQIINTYKSLDLIKNEANATIELMIPPYYRDYYFKKYNRQFESVFYNPFTSKPDTKTFKKFVYHQTTEYFIAGGLPLEYIQLIKEKYPYTIHKEEGFTYSTYCFSKNKNPTLRGDKVLFSKVLVNNEESVIDSIVEYGQSYTFNLHDIINDRHSIINISAQLFSSDSSANPLLVMDVQQNNESLRWAGVEYVNFTNDPRTFNTVYLSTDLSSFNFNKYEYAELKIYIWNRNKKAVSIKNFEINVTEGNHFLYSLYEPINLIKRYK